MVYQKVKKYSTTSQKLTPLLKIFMLLAKFHGALLRVFVALVNVFGACGEDILQ
jgi:hypothetical protein